MQVVIEANKSPQIERNNNESCDFQTAKSLSLFVVSVSSINSSVSFLLFTVGSKTVIIIKLD